MEAICGKCGARLRINIPESYTEPSIQFKCGSCGAVNNASLKAAQKPNLTEPNPEETQFYSQPGWLVVHDENTKTQTYSLKTGKNTVGRQNTSRVPDIQIETNDSFMSRMHCQIEVKQTNAGKFEYILSDPGHVNGFSLNGTTINADVKKKLGPYDKLYLVDGDVIQAGRTKIVLKTPATVKNKTEAEKTVIVRDYSKTVIL